MPSVRKSHWLPIFMVSSLVLILPTVAAWAQPSQPAIQNQPRQVPTAKPAVAAKLADPKADPKVKAAQTREKLHQRIRTLRAQKLAEVIKPDAATAKRLQEVAEKFEDQLAAVRQEAAITKRDLQKSLQAPKPDDAALNRLTDQMLSQRAKLHKLEDDRNGAVRKVLSAAQFSRLLIAWPKINKSIQEEMYKAILKQQSGTLGANGAAQPVGDDF